MPSQDIIAVLGGDKIILLVIVRCEQRILLLFLFVFSLYNIVSFFYKIRVVELLR